MKHTANMPLCRAARLVLRIELPLILLYTVGFLVSYLCARAKAPAIALHYFAPLLGYLYVPPLLSAFSALLIQRLHIPDV